MEIPLPQRLQIRQIEDIVGHPPPDVAVEPGMKILHGGRFFRPPEQFASLGAILPPNLPRRDHRSETDSGRPHQSALSSEKNRGLPEHHAAGNVPQKRRRRLVLVGGVVEMDVGAPHLAVIPAAGPPGDQGVAEVDQAAQRDERKEDGLFQSHGVAAVRLFLEEAPLPNLGAGSHIRPIQEHGGFEKSPLELDIPAEPAVRHRDRRFAAQFYPRRDQCFWAGDLGPRV